MDLFGPTRVASLDGIYYAYVLVDDYSKNTWACFLTYKNYAFKTFENFSRKVQKEKGFYISSIRSDHGTEFENEFFKTFYSENGVSYTFFSPRTPQQNGVVERKNRTLVEMAGTMLHEYSLPLYFWAEAVNTSCYISNRVFKRPILNKISYEL